MTWLLSLELLAIYEAGTNGDRVRSVVEGGGEEGSEINNRQKTRFVDGTSSTTAASTAPACACT